MFFRWKGGREIIWQFSQQWQISQFQRWVVCQQFWHHCGKLGAYLVLIPRCRCDWKLSFGPADAKLSAEPRASCMILLSRLLPADCTLSHLRSRCLSLSLCHWLVFWGLQTQLHGRHLIYLRHLKRWWNPSSTTVFSTLFERCWYREKSNQAWWAIPGQKTVASSTSISDFNLDEVPTSRGASPCPYTKASCSTVP